MKAKVRRPVSFDPSNRPTNDFVSHVIQSDSSTTPRMQKGSFTFTQTNIELHNKTEAIGKRNNRLWPSAGPNDFNLRFKNGPHDVVPLLSKRTYRTKISFFATTNALLTTASLLNTVVGQNLIDKVFLQLAWR